MARNDDSQRDPSTPSRVYKASNVHKRRVDRKGRVKGEGKPAEPTEPTEPPAEPTAPTAPAMSEPPAEAPVSGAPGKSAVVIAPEFGRKTQAQKEADDRWFAAMRNGGIPPIGDEELGGRQGPDPEPAPGQQPEMSSQQLAAQGQRPAAQGQRPAAQGQRPETPAQQPGAPEQQAVLQEQRQDAPGQQPESPAQQSATQGEQGADSDQRPEAAGQQPASSDQAEPTRRPSIRGPQSRKGKIALIVIAVVLVIGIAAAVAFAWNRWYRFDDHADMQGQWYVVGTTVPVVIDGSSIRLTDDVTYQYEIDTRDKTISYTFGPMAGQGRYWFSNDRRYLVITDGDGFTSASTAFDDLMRMFRELSDKVTNTETKLPEGEGIIAFSREPDADALAKQQAEAEAKQKAEEAARKEAERKAAEEAAAEAADAAAAEAAAAEYYEEAPPAEGPHAEEAAPAEEAASEDASGEDTPSEDLPSDAEGGEA